MEKPLNDEVPPIDTLGMALATANCRRVAIVKIGRDAWDLASITPSGQLAIARCVSRAKASDYRALKTMLAEGDFDRAVLVFCDAEQPFLSDEIESWAIGDVDRLAASLVGQGA